MLLNFTTMREIADPRSKWYPFFIRGNITILSIFVVNDTEIYKGSLVLTVSCLDIRRATYQSILSLLISETSKFFRSYW